MKEKNEKLTKQVDKEKEEVKEKQSTIEKCEKEIEELKSNEKRMKETVDKCEKEIGEMKEKNEKQMINIVLKLLHQHSHHKSSKILLKIFQKKRI